MPDLRLLQFTPVELAFLARATNTDAGRTTSDKLLLGDESSNAVIASGYGGLRLRGWANAGGDRLELDPALAGIADVFGTANQWIQLSFLDGDEASSVLVVRGKHLAVVLRPLAAGIIDVAAIEPEVGTESVCGDLIGAFLARANADTVTVELESEASARSAAARNERGRWLFQTAVGGLSMGEDADVGIEAHQVATRFSEWLAA